MTFGMTPLPPERFLRSFHISPRYGICYVNNAKVACSSIKLALQRAQVDDPAYQPPVSIHNWQTSPLITARDLTFESWRDAIEDCFIFSFVRSPWARLRSAYLNKIVTGQKNGAFRIQLNLDPDEPPSFEAFVHALAQQDPQRMNVHWRPQWINISHDVIRFDFIGRLEQVADDWRHVAKMRGLDPVLPRAGKSTKGGADTLCFDAEMTDVVRDIYAQDFARFGYSDTPP